MFVIQWANYQMPARLVSGHSLVGLMQKTGVFAALECPADPTLSRAELLSGEHSDRVISDFLKKPMDEHADFILNTCEQEAQHGGGFRLCSHGNKLRRCFRMGMHPSLLLFMFS